MMPPPHPCNCDLRSKWHYRHEEIGLWYSRHLLVSPQLLSEKHFSTTYLFFPTQFWDVQIMISGLTLYFCLGFFFYCKINVEWHLKFCQMRTTWNLEDFKCSTRSSCWINEICEDGSSMQTIAFWGLSDEFDTQPHPFWGCYLLRMNLH